MRLAGDGGGARKIARAPCSMRAMRDITRDTYILEIEL